MTAARALLLGSLSLLCLLLLPAASGQVDPVRQVVYDLFEDGEVDRFTYETPCENAVFVQDPDSASFTFQERGTGATPPGFPLDLQGNGLGCGAARWRVEVPQGADHIHVRFFADRQVEALLPSLGHSFVQELRIQDVNGATLAIFPVHEPRDDPFEEQYRDTVNYPVPDGVTLLDIVWWFEDRGVEGTPGEVDASGQWSATVRAPQVEYSGVPVLDVEVDQQGRRGGTIVVDDTRVQAPVPRDLAQRYHVVVRVAVHPDLAVEHVRTPTGAVLEEVLTRNGTNRFVSDKVLLEQGANMLQVYLPAPLVAEHGHGTYTILFRGVSDLDTVPALIPVAALLLLLPIPFAIAAVMGARTFEREAFGGFRRSAHRLAIAVPIAVAYYVAVVVAALVGRRLELMTAWPMGLEGLFLYIQVLVAIAAFLALWLTARELARLTRPAEGKP